MKKLFKFYFVLITALLVLFGCSNPSGSSDPDYPPPPPGSGYFFFTLDMVNTGRTILPVTVQADFLAYNLDFCAAGTTTPVIKNESRTNANLNSPVTLNVGTYDLFITAYMDTAKTKPAAKATLSSIAISNSTPYTGSVSLKEIAVGGQGTFSWKITSSGVTLTKATMSITPLDVGGTSAKTVDLTANSNSSATLNSGYYRVVIHLDNNKGECAERTEILHVYQNMKSDFTYSFNANEFHFIRVVEVNFANSTETVNLCNLVGNDVYLVKVNTAVTTPLNVLAADTGRVLSSTPNPSSGPILPDANQSPNQLPIEFPKWTMGRPYGEVEYPVSKNDSNSSSSPNPGLIPPPYAINQVIQFWLEVDNSKPDPKPTRMSTGYFEERNATLVYSGTYCNVWVLNENYGKDTTTGITSPNQIDNTKAKQIADIFDNIYPKETTLLGYENGGGPGGNGGLDGDKRVQILVYDLNGGNTAGFFWGKDFNPYGGVVQKSNQKEMVYVDANVLLTDPLFTTSLLVHEFQHLIGYSIKVYKAGLPSSSFSGWYTEMLSLMTEDIIDPLAGITPGASYSSGGGHPIDGRLFYFMYAYEPKDEGVNEWFDTCGYRYENKFAFGAYLLRNFGGAELLRRISQNNYVGEQSIAEALKDWFNDNGNPKFNADSTAAYRYAVERYSEALLFGGTAPDGVLSFNKTVSYTITGDYGQVTYTTIPFDIWGNRWSGWTVNYWPIKGMKNIYGVADGDRKDMRRSSVSLHTSTGWKNVTGNFSVTLQQPNSPNIKMYLMVK